MHRFLDVSADIVEHVDPIFFGAPPEAERIPRAPAGALSYRSAIAQLSRSAWMRATEARTSCSVVL